MRAPYRGIVGLLMACLLFASCGGSAEDGVIYWCSMHPDVRQPEPGTCPLCGGMRLVPLEQGLVGADPGILRLTDGQIQQAGVRLAPVEERDLQRVLDFGARFAVDPRLEVTVHNPIPGSSIVAKVHFPTAGQLVQEGDVLIELENELLEQQVQQLRDAIARYEDLKVQEGRELQAAEMLKRKEAVHQQLEDAGVEREWAMLLAHEGRRREQTPLFPVRSPTTGVLMRTPLVRPGRFARQGEAIFYLADISQLWLELEVHDRDLAWLTRGLRVKYESPAVVDQVFWTSLDAVELIADRGQPELRVRARATSAKGRILPGTWARASVVVDAPEVLAVPVDAVLRSGLRDVAIVAEGDGRFRPALLTLGRRDLSLPEPRRQPGAAQTTSASAATTEAGHRPFTATRFHEVLAGLRPGERVVSAGSFLLFSEASFQGALSKLVSEDTAAAGAASPEAAAKLGKHLDALLTHYESLRKTFSEDDATGLAAPAQQLQAVVQAAGAEDLPTDASAALKRLGLAAVALEQMTQVAPEVNLEEARILFGSISREVVNLVRGYAPARVEEANLVLFRCPMAEDYGFDLWFQTDAQMANPYMGQRMLECGEQVEL